MTAVHKPHRMTDRLQKLK